LWPVLRFGRPRLFRPWTWLAEGLSFMKNPPPAVRMSSLTTCTELTHHADPQLCNHRFGVLPRAFGRPAKRFSCRWPTALSQFHDQRFGGSRKMVALHKAVWTPSILKIRGPVIVCTTARRTPVRRSPSAGRDAKCSGGAKQITCRATVFLPAHAGKAGLHQMLDATCGPIRPLCIIAFAKGWKAIQLCAR